VHTIDSRSQHARTAAVGPMLCLIGAVLVSGCAQQPQVKGAWQEGAPRKQSFTKVLIVGVSPHVNQRCRFEAFMASQLKSESVKAIRSCDAVTKKDPLTLESIEQAVASVQADAVLATNLVSSEFEAKEGGSRDTRGSAMYKATDAGYATGYYGGYGVYGVPVVYGEFATAPAITTVQGEVRVSSRFYETRGKTLIYTLDTQARNLESTDVALSDIATAIANQLRRDGLTH
jgi:hypothetical protein